LSAPGRRKDHGFGLRVNGGAADDLAHFAWGSAKLEAAKASARAESRTLGAVESAHQGFDCQTTAKTFRRQSSISDITLSSIRHHLEF
jgi:hypothetical protein